MTKWLPLPRLVSPIKMHKISAGIGMVCSLLYVAPMVCAATPPHNDKTNTVLDRVPQVIDAFPTFLPPQSDQAIVPETAMTQHATWADRQQNRLHLNLQEYATDIDSWFGENEGEQAASASLRILLDNQWNKYDGYHLQPRVRGSIHLPTLQKRVSVVFGDDTLDNELRQSVAINNENPLPDSSKVFDHKQAATDNSAIALRWERWKNPWGLKTHADVGLRSGNDIYLRLKAQKDWELGNDFYSYIEQIYRYGSQSEHYLRTNLELRHTKAGQAFLANQASLTGTYENGAQNWYWDNRLYRQHQFFHHHEFNYGISLGGYLSNDLSALNSYGPFVSWRQPVWREWFFVHGELNYLNNKLLDRNHHASALLRLETWF